MGQTHPVIHRILEADMAWNTPEIEEVTCGMEINMYFPAEAEDDLF